MLFPWTPCGEMIESIRETTAVLGGHRVFVQGVRILRAPMLAIEGWMMKMNPTRSTSARQIDEDLMVGLASIIDPVDTVRILRPVSTIEAAAS